MDKPININTGLQMRINTDSILLDEDLELGRQFFDILLMGLRQKENKEEK